jgi:hypothetical protein
LIQMRNANSMTGNYKPAQRGARLLLIAVAWTALAGAARAQVFELRSLNPLAPDTHGLRLYGVSVYSSYSTAALPPLASTSNPLTNATYLAGQSFGADLTSGVSANLGWSWGKKSTFAIQYSFAFYGSVEHSEWNNFNHHFAFRGGRPVEISRKLKFSYGGTADMSTFQNFLFAPTQAATLVGTPMDFGDLSAAVLQHPTTNDQLAAALTGSPVADPTLSNLLYGNQVLTIGAQGNLTYTKSPRLNFLMMFSVMRLQPLSFGGGNPGSTTSSNSIFTTSSTTNLPAYSQRLGQDNAAGAGLGMSFLVSPRVTFGVTVMGNRTLSRLADQYVTTAAARLAVAVSRHWFVTATAGSGDLTRVRSSLTKNGGSAGWLAGLGIGTSFRKHTFIVMANRNVGDSWGLGADSNLLATGAWSWQIGRTWGTYASFSQQRLQSGSIGNINGWLAAAGVTRSLGKTLFMDVQYSYFRNFGTYASLPYNFSSNGAKVALTWTPAGMLAATRARTPSGFGSVGSLQE